MSGRNTVILLLCLCLLQGIAGAQSISISASVDRSRISINEHIVLKVKVSGNVQNLPEPKLPPLQGFSAQYSGRSQNVSMVNGQVSSSIDFNYILSPNAAGKQQIGPVTLNYNGQSYRTAPIEVEVTQGGVQQPAQPGASPQAAQMPDVMVDASVNKKTVYVGEQITYSLKIFYRINMRYGAQPPDTSGFWSEDLPPNRKYQQAVKGVGYNVLESRTALFPLAPGKYTIGRAMVQYRGQGMELDDFFSGFMSMGRTKQLQTNPVEVTVVPLPGEGKPADFTGTIGDYSISAKTDKKQVKVNEPVTLEVTVSGSGHIKTINEPKLTGLKSFRKYETISALNVEKKDYRVQGSKVFKTVLIPRASGKLTIPAIKYSYFNPAAKSYKTVQSKPITLNVLPGEKEEPKIITPEGIKLIGTDIRHIKTGRVDASGRGRMLHASPLFVMFQLFPMVCLGAGFAYRLRVRRLSSDIGYARATKAFRTARKALSSAKKLQDAGKSKEFYAVLSDCFTGYLANKLNLAQAGLTLNLLTDALSSRNIEKELTDSVRDIWQEFDFVRFAPADAGDASRIQETLAQTEELIRKLEKIL